MDRQAVTKYLDAVWAVVADANRYFAGEEPWAKKKTDFKRMETILYVTAEVVRQIAILAAPVMPHSAEKLLDLLGQGGRSAHIRARWARRGGSSPAPACPSPRASSRATWRPTAAKRRRHPSPQPKAKQKAAPKAAKAGKAKP